MTLEGRVAIVTGSGQGAGRAAARGLAGAGAQVVVADSFQDSGQETVALIEQAGGAATFVDLDITSEESTRAVASSVAGQFGRLDVLVNNAATYRATTRRPLDELSVDQWDTTMAVFVRGPWLMTKAAVPFLAEAPQPSIVNQTSVAAFGVSQWLDYGTARGAVIAMTKSLAMELAPKRIRVNALAVGSMGIEAIALGILEREDQMVGTPDFARQLIPRLGRETDVAGPVVFLASDASEYMTGQTIVADGGKFFVG
jgi:NAD(P)-dependent dehydrogenase (short-subunit alcohol dehydrogenase family)